MSTIEGFYEYKKAIGDRTALYRNVAKKFDVKSALYPGSHIDIMPSLIIPKVTYIDSFKGSISFFKDMKSIMDYVNTHKEYKSESDLTFIGGDYKDDYEIEEVDLLISQFAGFIGQDTKRYLKSGGILLCNDSHGDATLAYCDDDYEFIGVIDSRYKINSECLDDYFKFARQRPIDVEKVLKTMKGPKYKKKTGNYLFRKI